MTKQEYFEYAGNLFASCLEISKKKNADYTGTADNPFANFTNTATSGGATTEQGFLIRMTDKMMRISSFVQKGILEVKDESVNDTLKDLINYACLMSAYIQSKKS
jgi:hypothetical protein